MKNILLVVLVVVILLLAGCDYFEIHQGTVYSKYYEPPYAQTFNTEPAHYYIYVKAVDTETGKVHTECVEVPEHVFYDTNVGDLFDVDNMSVVESEGE